MLGDFVTKYYTVRKISLEFKFDILLIANSLNLNSAYYYIFRNLFMIAYITEIQRSKFVTDTGIDRAHRQQT